MSRLCGIKVKVKFNALDLFFAYSEYFRIDYLVICFTNNLLDIVKHIGTWRSLVFQC